MKHKVIGAIIGLLILTPSAAFAADLQSQYRDSLIQLISLLTAQVQQLQLQLAAVNESVDTATTTPEAPVFGSVTPIEVTPLLTDLIEVHEGAFRIESNKPLDFANTKFSGNVSMVQDGEVVVSTGYFRVPGQYNQTIYPSYYYTGTLSGVNGDVTATVTDLDGQTLSHTFHL
jgi:hypothetical protein